MTDFAGPFTTGHVVTSSEWNQSKTSVDELKTLTNAQAGSITTLQGTSADHETRLDAVEVDAIDHEGRITTLEGYVQDNAPLVDTLIVDALVSNLNGNRTQMGILTPTARVFSGLSDNNSGGFTTAVTRVSKPVAVQLYSGNVTIEDLTTRVTTGTVATSALVHAFVCPHSPTATNVSTTAADRPPIAIEGTIGAAGVYVLYNASSLRVGTTGSYNTLLSFGYRYGLGYILVLTNGTSVQVYSATTPTGTWTVIGTSAISGASRFSQGGDTTLTSASASTTVVGASVPGAFDEHFMFFRTSNTIHRVAISNTGVCTFSSYAPGADCVYGQAVCLSGKNVWCFVGMTSAGVLYVCKDVRTFTSSGSWLTRNVAVNAWGGRAASTMAAFYCNNRIVILVAPTTPGYNVVAQLYHVTASSTSILSCAYDIGLSFPAGAYSDDPVVIASQAQWSDRYGLFMTTKSLTDTKMWWSANSGMRGESRHNGELQE